MDNIKAINSQYSTVDLGEGIGSVLYGDDGYLQEEPLLATAFGGKGLSIKAEFARGDTTNNSSTTNTVA